MSDWADIVDQGAGIIIERFAYFADANPNYLSGTDLEQRKTSYASFEPFREWDCVPST